VIARLGLALALVVGLLPVSARASEPSGTISGHAIIGAGSLTAAAPELGGGGIGDLLFGGGPMRLGGALGTWFVDDAQGGRLVAPLALSSAIRIEPRPVGANFRGRVGLGTGATADGFYAAAFLSVGVFIDFRLDEVISIGVGSDVSFLIGKSGRTDFMPGVVLSFTPKSST
jgi:hypothetical protein